MASNASQAKQLFSALRSSLYLLLVPRICRPYLFAYRAGKQDPLKSPPQHLEMHVIIQ